MPNSNKQGRNTRRAKVDLEEINVDEQLEEEYQSQTNQEKREVRNKIRDIFNRVEESRKEGIKSGDVFSGLLEEAKQVVTGVKGTHEAIEDAKMFHALCQFVREMSEDTNTNEKNFSIDEYTEMIGRNYNASRDNKNDLRMTKNQFISLGKRYSSKFARVPAFTFILGAIDTELGEQKKRKPREKRPERERPVATKTAIVSRSQADGQQRTSKLVESTRKILEKRYSHNNKRPVDYFKFVIDPDSFGNTVENMFHVSFLVKQRVVELGISEKVGLPILTPLSSSSRRAGGDEGESEGKNQAIISLSFEDWEELKEALEVTSAAIVHDEDLRNF